MERASATPIQLPREPALTDGAPAPDTDHTRPGAEGTPTAQAPLLVHVAPTAVAAIGLGALAFAVYPLGPRAALAALFAAVLVVLAAIDLERRIIPNAIVLPATVIVLAAHIAIAPGRTVELILAPLAAGLFLLLPNLINPSAMGMGDVKLALLLGVGLGWGVFGALIAGFLASVPFAVAVILKGGTAAARTKTMPLGPFLAFGGLVVLIVSQLTT